MYFIQGNDNDLMAPAVGPLPAHPSGYRPLPTFKGQRVERGGSETAQGSEWSRLEFHPDVPVGIFCLGV